MVTTAPALPAASAVAASSPDVLQEVIRAAYRVLPDPCGLIGDEPFTLRELMLLHEDLLGVSLTRERKHFRDVMSAQLVATGLRRTGVVGKPAELFIKP